MSSFYEDASLVVIPSGYKTSKIYAEKPTDGSGDLTFTRASDATRVGPDGLIEKVRTNLNLHSNDFSNAAWSKLSNASVSGTRVADPFGGNTAWQFIFDGTANGRIEQTISGAVANLEYTFSVWLRVASGTQSVIIASRGTETTVTVTTTWQRFTSTSAAASTDAYPRVRCDSAVTIQAYGAQTEIGDIATAYIPTTTAAVSVGPVSNVPRLDYLGSSCPRLLLEPQRTNLVTFSESFNNAAYTKTNVSVTANNTISPDGYINADKLVENTSNAIHGVRAVIASSINPFTFSVFAKSFSGNRYLQLRMANDVSGSIVALFDLDNGTIIIDTTLYGGGYSVLPSKIISLGNGWYKCSISGNKTDNVGNNNVEINLSSTTTPAEVYSYTGNGTSGVFVYGAQLEAGAASTSYIPTLAASVTRVADAASKTGISSLIGQTEGVLYVDFVPQNNPIASTPQWLMFLGSVSTYISIFLSNGGKIRANVADTTDQCVIDTSYNFVAGTRYKCALAYKANDFAFYVNGALVGTDTSGTVPAVSTLQNNYNTTAANGTNAGLNQMLLFKTRLTNAQLAELTTL